MFKILLEAAVSNLAQLLEALKARGVAGKTAQELVDAHPHSRINTKIEVFDWLMRNEDKRVGKNPAGYLVASIRSDYKVPGDYQGQASTATKTDGASAGTSPIHNDLAMHNSKPVRKFRPSTTR